MKKLIYKILFLSFIISNISFSANELYRSRTSGNWTTPSTWEYSTDGGSTWITATSTFPDVNSGVTEVRNTHNVTVPASTPLAINQFIIRSGGTVTINTGASLTIGDQTSQDLLMENAANMIGNGGIVKTYGPNVELLLQSGCNFIAPLKIDTLTSTIYNNSGDITAVLKGPVDIDSGSTLAVASGGYRVRFDSTLRNLGNIIGSGSFVDFSGYSMVNYGNISVTTLNFNDSSVVVADTTNKAGKFTSPNINIQSTGRVKHNGNNWTIGPSNTIFNILGGGKLDVSTTNFILDGTSGTIQFNLDANGRVVYSGVTYPFQTKGNVNLNLKTSSNFNAGLKVLSGLTTCYSELGPSIGEIFSPVTIDPGATFNVNSGGYGVRAYNTVINNGTITGSGSYFYMRGSSFANLGSVSSTNFYFDSTTSLSGTGIWASPIIRVRSTGNLSLANNLSIGASTAVNLFVDGGGVLNPNTRTLTLNGTIASLNLTISNAGTIFNSGIIQTQGTVNLDLQTGCIFNAPLKVNTGTSTAYSSVGPSIANFNNTLTVDLNTNFNVASGGYGINSKSTLTNNGTISGSGSFFFMNGSSIANGGTINVTNFYFDDTTSISGNGLWASPNIVARNSAMVSLANNLSFGPATLTFTFQASCTLNPNGFIFTLIGNPGITLAMQNGSTALNSGSIRTQQNIGIDLQTGCNFNTPLNVNTGTTSAYSSISPSTAVFNGTILIDTGSILNVSSGGYYLNANDNVTNNGTITGSGSYFRFYGQTFTNNGTVNPSNFYFESITFSPTSFHTLTGTGSFTTSNCNIVQGSNVTLLSTHKFAYLNVNTGGTFDITSRTLKLTGGGVPLGVTGNLITNGSTVEYNGATAQTLAQQNINYNNLTINDTAGVTMIANLYMPGILSVSAGDLNLNGNIIYLLTSATLTETSGNTVTGTSGYITTTRNLNAASGTNVAGMGATITTLANLGLTQIIRGHSVQTLPGGNQSIKRYYAINPQNNSSLNATLVFKYDDSELNGQPENTLAWFKSTNGGSSFFFETSVLNTTNNTFTKTGVSSISRYTFGTGLGFVNLTVVPEGFYNTSNQKMNSSDTVRLYLRNINTPYAIVDSSIGKLDSNTLSVNLSFTRAGNGTYYLDVKHRNSIETWSKTGGEIYTVGSTLNYSFTSAQTQAYGNNTVIKGTKFTIYSGDVNQDGAVDLADLTIIDNDANNFESGYVPSDVNGDYVVDVSDAAITDNNAFNFVIKVTP